MNWTTWLYWLIAAFACGSIPFAVIIGKAKGVDIRTVGSGNPGATNLGRAVGKKWGLLCFVLDVGKGLVPTLAYAYLPFIIEMCIAYNRGHHFEGWFTSGCECDGPPWWALQWVLIAIASVCGHIFSPFLKFKGGKGVATGLGATLGLFPVVTVPGLLAFVIWYAVCKISGYVGLASVIAAASLPLLTIASALTMGLTPGETAVFTGLTALLAALVIGRHWGNLKRLRAGTEPKATWTGKASPSSEQ